LKDFLAVAEAFGEELERGLRGQTSSLAMKPSRLVWSRKSSGGRALVLDAGGTRFRAAVVRWDQGGQEVERQTESPMPGSQGPLGGEAFFDAMAVALDGLAEEGLPVGFCFSFPADIQHDRDGRLLQFCKEIQAPEVEGQLVGLGLRNAMARRGLPRVGPVTVLNDTVATLLAGAGLPEAAAWSSGVGLILGTGTNGCYPEPERKGEIFNTEWGAFRGFPRTELDRGLEATTQDPEDYWFEKTMAGAYLGPLCSLAVSRSLGREQTWSTADLAQPLALPDGDPVRTVVEGLVDRAAGFLAAATAAVVWRTDGGHEAAQPVGLVAEGSTFWNLPGFAGRFERHLQGLLQGDRRRYYRLCQISQAPFWGSAVATRW